MRFSVDLRLFWWILFFAVCLNLIGFISFVFVVGCAASFVVWFLYFAFMSEVKPIREKSDNRKKG